MKRNGDTAPVLDPILSRIHYMVSYHGAAPASFNLSSFGLVKKIKKIQGSGCLDNEYI